MLRFLCRLQPQDWSRVNGCEPHGFSDAEISPEQCWGILPDTLPEPKDIQRSGLYMDTRNGDLWIIQYCVECGRPYLRYWHYHLAGFIPNFTIDIDEYIELAEQAADESDSLFSMAASEQKQDRRENLISKAIELSIISEGYFYEIFFG